MTGVVVVWLGVSSTCHAGTNKQHSIAWGRREEEQPYTQPVNVTPSSPSAISANKHPPACSCWQEAGGVAV